MLNNDSAQFQSKEEIIKFALAAQNGNRYSGINFMNVGNDKNTIEFRLANGTVDENTWIENINLFGGIIKAAEELTNIQNKPEEERTDEEKEKLRNFEEIKNSELDDKERFEKLMVIAIKKENRKIYRGRFNTNSKLMQQNKTVERKITKFVTKSGIDIMKAGKKVFTGEDRVTGQDYREIELFINKQMNKDQEQIKG